MHYRGARTKSEIVNWKSRSHPSLTLLDRSTTFTAVDKLWSCYNGSYWRGGHPRLADVGGDFRVTHEGFTHLPTQVYDTANYKGPAILATAGGSFTGLTNDVNTIPTGTMNAFGTKAIAVTTPTRPRSGLARTIGELKKDGLPDLPGHQTREQVKLARAAGSEYLNVEFGWLPLVSDLRKFADTVRNSRVLLQQYLRDSDRPVRRRFSELGTDVHNVYSSTSNIGLTHNCKLTSSESLQRELWFSGAFRYHVPKGDDLVSKLLRWEHEANYLYGTRVTPEVVWQVAPWSWAIDWFTNIGNVITNVTNLGLDALVLNYGYVMYRQELICEYSATCTEVGSMALPGGPVLQGWRKTSKTRLRSNPYGFGIDDLSLSVRQLAVLAALGLTKGKRFQNP